MRRLPLLAWVVTVAVALFLLYRVKYEVQSIHAQVEDTERQLESEREALHVVAAEWAYLNRPDRLRQLSSKYLSSTGLTVGQIAEIEAIPYPKQNVASLDITPAHYKEEGE
jgi:hypothetical protein